MPHHKNSTPFQNGITIYNVNFLHTNKYIDVIFPLRISSNAPQPPPLTFFHNHIKNKYTVHFNKNIYDNLITVYCLVITDNIYLYPIGKFLMDINWKLETVTTRKD